jgi:diguanylate cyclase (GGDEF)-like protein/PAS domain S-box-containing protein
MFVVLIVALGVALLLSSGVQRTIALPIRELSRVARRVTAEKDYSARAAMQSGAELGILIDSFNQMLAEIERRDLARKAAEELLRESEERYALAARGANDGLWDWKLSTGEIYFSPRWVQMIGYSEGEIAPEPGEWFGRIHPADVSRVQAELTAHRTGATAEFVSEYRMRHRNGSFIWMLSRGAVVRDPSGMAVRMAGSQTDITDGKVVDPLTNLPNRLYFLDRLDAAIENRAGDYAEFAVLFVDLDRFKLVNDSLGHAAGDELLTGIAGRLKSSVRAAPRKPDRAASVVARLGGDEFAILLSDIADASEARVVAERLLADLSAPFQIAGRQVFGMISIGIAPGSSGNTPEDLLRNADTAMYHAKAKGKGRFEVFDETMRDRARARMEIETDLRRAIELNQLVVYYQPQVALGTGRVYGYEALVRWMHPCRGLIPPSEFIPIAEETDLILPLGRIVLREACRQMAEWQTKFEHDPPLSVSVNVSVRQLTSSNLVEDVRAALAESGLPPSSLHLEVTESSVMTNTDIAVEVLRGIKELGVGLEIDDFGTGYSSLGYLSRLPFDTVKIDQSFVRDLHRNREAADIVRTIFDLANSMNLSVIAEGVETNEQLAALSSLGCQYGQGFYFAKPADRDCTQALMLERSTLRQAFAQLAAAPPEPVIAAEPVNTPDEVLCT